MKTLKLNEPAHAGGSKKQINPRCLGSANQNKTMNTNTRKIGVLVALASTIAALCLPLATRASSEAFTTLYSFTGGSDGAQPFAGLIQGSDGNFYGTTSAGGANNAGTVFRMTPTGTLTTLYSFTGGSDGANPAAGLVQGSDGNFYGTTTNGGDSSFSLTCGSFFGCGTVFRMTPTGTLTTLHIFTGLGEAANPEAGLIQGSDGNFYGTTVYGGVLIPELNSGQGLGTVFQVTPTGVLTTLYRFTGGSDGISPVAGLIQGSDGNFYGTTPGGSALLFGTVFRLTVVAHPPLPPTGALITLHAFNGVTDGARPVAGLIQGSDGNFYGTVSQGGGTNNGYGAVFQMTPTGTLTTLHVFTGSGEGANPNAGLIQGSDGNFYGTTSSLSPFDGLGTVFQLTPTGTLFTLHAFTGGTDGASPYGGLIQGSDGELYGTTSSGGTRNSFGQGQGTVFRLGPRLLNGVVSRKIHGSAGAFDVDLPLTGPRGIECRSGGATSDFTLIFTFANPLTSVGDASVTGHDPAAGTGIVDSSAIDNNDAHNYIVNLTQVTNAQYIRVTLTNLTDLAGNSIPSVPGPSMGVLFGDVNANGFVTNADVSLVKAQVAAGGSVDASNFRDDVNANGVISNADVSLSKAQVAAGAQLPSPP